MAHLQAAMVRQAVMVRQAECRRVAVRRGATTRQAAAVIHLEDLRGMDRQAVVHPWVDHPVGTTASPWRPQAAAP
jgi:hypothetical protein